jgi:hypothetical protein
MARVRPGLSEELWTHRLEQVHVEATSVGARHDLLFGVTRMRDELGRFLDARSDHFADEERVVARSASEDGLAARHGELRKQLEAILGSVRVIPPAQCRNRLLELLDAIGEHERVEHE